MLKTDPPHRSRQDVPVALGYAAAPELFAGRAHAAGAPGEHIDQDLIKGIIDMFIDLGLGPVPECTSGRAWLIVAVTSIGD